MTCLSLKVEQGHTDQLYARRKAGTGTGIYLWRNPYESVHVGACQHVKLLKVSFYKHSYAFWTWKKKKKSSQLPTMTCSFEKCYTGIYTVYCYASSVTAASGVESQLIWNLTAHEVKMQPFASHTHCIHI